jgi:hypothetical protein
VAEQRDVGVLVVRRDRRRLADHQDVGAVVVGLLFRFFILPFWDERPNLLPEVYQNYLVKKLSVTSTAPVCKLCCNLISGFIF